MRRRLRSPLALTLVVLALLAASPTGAPAAETGAGGAAPRRTAEAAPSPAVPSTTQASSQAPSREAQATSSLASAPAAQPFPQPPSQEEEQEEDEAEEVARAALERTLIQRGGLLLPRWTLEVEPSVSYFHASADAINIDAVTILPFLAVGEIVSDRLRRDILQPTLTVRLGLPWGFQTDARVPYRYELERRVRADNLETRRESLALGDAEVALSYQLLREWRWIPDLLVSFRWKTTTGRSPFEVGPNDLPSGTGFNSIQGTLTAVKVRDPIVLFWGFSYTATLRDTKPIQGVERHVDPGDTWGGNVGLALALNLETSLNFSVEQRFTRRTLVDGQGIPGSFQEVGVFRVGASYTPASRVSVDVGVGIGLTRDAPDVQITLAIPIRFPR